MKKLGTSVIIIIMAVTLGLYLPAYGGSAFGADSSTTTFQRIQLDKSPFALSVNPATNEVYVADLNSGALAVIDGSTNKVIEKISDLEVKGLAVDSKRNVIYSTIAGWV